jgi:hypothetical protein
MHTFESHQQIACECNSPHYEQRKCNEHNHQQIARCVGLEDDATVSTKMQSIYTGHILLKGVSKYNIKLCSVNGIHIIISRLCPLISPSSDPLINVKSWHCRVTSPCVGQKCAQVKKFSTDSSPYSPYRNLLDYGTDNSVFLMIKSRWSRNIMKEKHLSITDICIQIKNF